MGFSKCSQNLVLNSRATLHADVYGTLVMALPIVSGSAGENRHLLMMENGTATTA